MHTTRWRLARPLTLGLASTPEIRVKWRRRRHREEKEKQESTYPDVEGKTRHEKGAWHLPSVTEWSAAPTVYYVYTCLR